MEVNFLYLKFMHTIFFLLNMFFESTVFVISCTNFFMFLRCTFCRIFNAHSKAKRSKGRFKSHLHNWLIFSKKYFFVENLKGFVNSFKFFYTKMAVKVVFNLFKKYFKSGNLLLAI